MPAVQVPRALPHQIDVLTHPARFKLLLCGRRWGKTAAGLMAAVIGHGEERGQWIGAADGGNVFWIAPTYKQSTAIWRDLKRAMGEAAEHKNEQDRDIFLPNGGRVGVRSADNPDSLRGEGLDGAILDEAAFMKPETWYSVVRPMLSETGGWAFFPTTPNGHNWIKDLSETAKSAPDWAFWQRPTVENPRVPAAEIKAARRELGQWQFEQEYEAKFIKQEGAEWPDSYFNDIWCDGWPSERHLVAVALDPSLGKTDRSDYSAFVAACKGHDGRYYIDANIERRPSSQLVSEGVDWMCGIRPDAFGCETNQFQELLRGLFVDRIHGAGISMGQVFGIHNSLAKLTRIRMLTPLLADGRIKLVRGSRGCDLLLEQLRGFPSHAHDDGPDALEMAIRLCEELLAGTAAAEPLDEVLTA